MINMKKLIVILLSVILCVSYLAATEPDTLLIVAYDGIAGIPVGTNYYHSAAGGTWIKETKDETTKDSINFTDNEMIGFIQLFSNESPYNVTMNGTLTVTVTCPNGFYLTSQSNPNYKRPFQILISPTWDSSTVISEDNPTQVYKISNKTSNEFHIDVVISLPGETDNVKKECTVTTNGKSVIYSLTDASDYSAVVTFDVKYVPSNTSAETIEKNLTLPFAGYYKSSVSNPQPQGDGVSMNIILNSEAYNIDIKNKRGVWIPIGEFYFNMMLGQTSSQGSKNAAIFFSTSENPYDTNASAFKMVHDDVGATTPLTSQNSIGFTLRTVNIDDTSEVMTFDGTTYFEHADGSTTSSIDETKYIIPTLTTDEMWSYLYYEWDYGKSLRSYLRYSGRIEIMLDNNDITMHEGRYTETIYVHVMVYQ